MILDVAVYVTIVCLCMLAWAVILGVWWQRATAGDRQHDLVVFITLALAASWLWPLVLFGAACAGILSGPFYLGRYLAEKYGND